MSTYYALIIVVLDTGDARKKMVLISYLQGADSLTLVSLKDFRFYNLKDKCNLALKLELSHCLPFK